MKVTSNKSSLGGVVVVPASKSHTIRAVILGSLASGESVIESPLDSFDTRSAVASAEAMGAQFELGPDNWTVRGVAGKPCVPVDIIDVGNSGTTLCMIMGTAALVDGLSVLTGDDQIQKRTAQPLIDALFGLGVEVISTRGNGMAPLSIKGPMKGGRTHVRGISSQYLSSLLMTCPLADHDTEIAVTELNETPYVHITLNWLKELGISLEHDNDLTEFKIPGNQALRAFKKRIAGDFSSATFLLCAGVLAGGTLTIEGLDMDDPQGDKIVIDILRRMGADIETSPGKIVVRGGKLKGVNVDMNTIPDAIPMLAACACFAEGTTVLHNVAHARMKETDRLKVMAEELGKLGADIKEEPDGLIINGTGLKGGVVRGHGDHRVVMALAVAGCAADGPITIDTAEAAGVTFPGFWDTMRSVGAEFEMTEN